MATQPLQLAYDGFTPSRVMSRLNLKTNRVQSSFKSLRTRLSVVMKKINLHAAGEMRAGHYEAAKGLMDIGRSYLDMSKSIEKMANEWDELVSQTNARLADLGLTAGDTQAKLTSSKALCIRALQLVQQRGGHAEMSDLVSDLDREGIFREADLKQVRGAPRWQLTLEKAYRRGQRQGWIERREDGIWDLTSKGRAAVEEHSQE